MGADDDTSPLLRAFDFQVRWCREPAPFTAGVLQHSRHWLAQDAAAHQAFAACCPEDPLAGAIALRWAGALHHLALRGLQPWASLWPPAAAATSEPDGYTDRAWAAAVRKAWAEHRSHCLSALSRPPQTNEVMRSAVLLPGLLHVAARTGRPLSLLEVGASAGLNLWCDRYRHAHDRWSWGAADAPVTLSSEWRGDVFAEAGTNFHISRRAGCDAHPVDLRVADEGLRLASFVWPEQTTRLARLHAARTAAARWMADDGLAVQARQAADFVADELRAPLPGHVTVLMHSVVWQYIAPGEQAAITAAMETAGARATVDAPLAWLRMEPPAPDSGIELRCRLWPGGEDRLLARAHPHGAWIDWQG